MQQWICRQFTQGKALRQVMRGIEVRAGITVLATTAFKVM
jgi:hypothetical protein